MDLSARIHWITNGCMEVSKFYWYPNSNPNGINAETNADLLRDWLSALKGLVMQCFGVFFHWIADL
jgi:hypothetical protein